MEHETESAPVFLRMDRWRSRLGLTFWKFRIWPRGEGSEDYVTMFLVEHSPTGLGFGLKLPAFIGDLVDPDSGAADETVEKA